MLKLLPCQNKMKDYKKSFKDNGIDSIKNWMKRNNCWLKINAKKRNKLRKLDKNYQSILILWKSSNTNILLDQNKKRIFISDKCRNFWSKDKDKIMKWMLLLLVWEDKYNKKVKVSALILKKMLIFRVTFSVIDNKNEILMKAWSLY